MLFKRSEMFGHSEADDSRPEPRLSSVQELELGTDTPPHTASAARVDAETSSSAPKGANPVIQPGDRSVRKNQDEDDTYLNLKGGDYKNLRESALIGTGAALALFGLGQMAYPIDHLPWWALAGIGLLVVGLLYSQWRNYQFMLRMQRGRKAKITVKDLIDGKYYETLGQRPIKDGYIEADIKRKGVTSAIFVGFEYEVISDSRKERLQNNVLPARGIVTVGGRYDIRPVDEAEFDFDATSDT